MRKTPVGYRHISDLTKDELAWCRARFEAAIRGEWGSNKRVPQEWSRKDPDGLTHISELTGEVAAAARRDGAREEVA